MALATNPLYVPTPPTIAPQSEDARNLSDWLQRELERISNAFSDATALELRPIHAAPPDPREGMIVYADGTSWNPGFGVGPYVYSKGMWVPLFFRAKALTVLNSSNAALVVPAYTQQLAIEAIGGGASGGGGDTTGARRGSGGGGGGYLFKLYSGVMDATLNVTIGAGGASVTAQAGGIDGNNGGSTTVVGAHLGTLTAGGGSKGLAPINSGGAGGIATGGDINIQGCDGVVANIGGTPSAAVASGGFAPLGGPGGQANVGSNGYAPGGGGACGNHTGGATSGAGANGQVRIWVF